MLLSISVVSRAPSWGLAPQWEPPGEQPRQGAPAAGFPCGVRPGPRENSRGLVQKMEGTGVRGAQRAVGSCQGRSQEGRRGARGFEGPRVDLGPKMEGWSREGRTGEAT